MGTLLVHWHYLYITNKNGKKVCKVLSCDKGKLIYYDSEVEIEGEWIELSAIVKNTNIAFLANGKLIEENVDASILSDEHIHLGFTGAMVGFNCIDMEKRNISAVFEGFEYRNIKE